MSVQGVVDLKRVHRIMAETDLDVLIVNSPANVWYLSGYPLALSGLQGSGYGRNATVIVPAGSEPILVPGYFEEQISRARSWVTDIEPFSDYIVVPVVAAAQVVLRRGLPHRRVGIELGHLSERFGRALKETLPESQLVPVDDMLDKLRAVKSPTEIEGLVGTLQRSARGAREAVAGLRAGEREVDAHNRLVMGMIRTLWSEKVDGTLLSGPRIRLWNGQAGDRILAVGDWVRLDYICASGGYPARICRMGTVGAPSSEQTEMLRRYTEGVQDALRRIVVGTTGSDACALITDALDANRIRLAPGAVGYGLGYGPVERPFLRPGEIWKLARGMVLSVEPRTIDGVMASWLVVVGGNAVQLAETALLPDRAFAI